MAKNILQRRWNGTTWEEIHPITKADNVITSDGMSIEEKAVEQSAMSANRNGYGTTTGTATAFMVTLTPAPPLVDGLRVTVKLNANNGTNPTLNVNGLGAKAILKPNGTAPAAALLKSGSVYTLVYNGTAFILQGEGGEYGTAVAADVRSGKTIGTDAGLINGELDSYDETDSSNYTQLAAGTPGGIYVKPYNGIWETSGSIALIDADYVASNIRSGVNMFGLIGTLIEGKRWATGTATSTGTNPNALATVTGLPFTPSVIIAINSGGMDDPFGIYWSGGPKAFNHVFFQGSVGTSAFTVSSGGFTFKTFNVYTVNWIAFE